MLKIVKKDPRVAEKVLPNTPSTQTYAEVAPQTPLYDKLSQVERGNQHPEQQPQSFDQHQDSNGDSLRQIAPPSDPQKEISDDTEREEYIYEKLRETTQKLDDATAALASLHSTDQYRMGDDRIARVRDELFHDIGQWSRNFHHPTKKASITKSVVETIRNAATGAAEDCPFRTVTPYYLKYLAEDEEKGPSLLVQGYVWKRLLADVFDRLVWTGGRCRDGQTCPAHKSFKTLEQITSDSSNGASRRKDYHHWRAQTARLVATSPILHRDCISDKINSIAKKISSDLRSYTDRKDIFGEKESSTGMDNLVTIVQAAVNFDLLLWQQKAKFVFTPYYPEPGAQVKQHKFKSVWMKGEYTEAQATALMRDGFIVKLFCAPALLKFGTSEGNDYENSILISKAEVDCLVKWAA